ncbi:Gluconate 2-dehydrogenase subunit 3 [Parapedobacter composti]|uniref:Gluconate 2-dehydrogenase subunit 3 n=1 Tax=Parapedobacter composti TaxID=623281 RepID=A0A1I1FB18_9SPHI|nr:gluconate 2-dehydrogenase subunit 3 family protein [Parapedobacter composti]SFB94270.1 Gluconate 2-dehydrogenase subunit 3 [Parapedobacter composti]
MIEKKINRRTALRNFLFIAGGSLILPACFRESGKASIALSNITVSEKDEELLAALVETLIPATDTPGGRELLLHLFVLKMVDDCHNPDEQRAFSEGLSSFAGWSVRELGGDYADADQERRLALLSRVEESGNGAIKQFMGITKRRTIQGYMNSQYVMTNLVKYELIPGRYNGYAAAT